MLSIFLLIGGNRKTSPLAPRESMRTECSMNNPLMEAGSEGMEVRGSRRWGQGEAWEGFWVARAEEELGRTHMGEELRGGVFRTGVGLLSAGTDWRKKRRAGMMAW